MRIAFTELKSFSFFRKHECFLTTCTEIAGFAFTVYLACKEKTKVEKLMEKRKSELNVEKLPAVENLKIVSKTVWPAALSFLGTSGLIGYVNHKNAKTIMSLGLQAATATKLLNNYKEAVVDKVGEKKAKAINDEATVKSARKTKYSDSDVIQTGIGDTLFYEPYSGKFFRSDIEFVKTQAIEFLKDWQQDDYGVVMNKFLERIGIGTSDACEYFGFLKSDPKNYTPYRKGPRLRFVADKRDTGHGDVPYLIIQWEEAPSLLDEEAYSYIGF